MHLYVERWLKGRIWVVCFLFFFSPGLITCYMTLPFDRGNQDKLSRRLDEALSTGTSGTQVLSSDISTISHFSTFSRASSLTSAFFILTLKPVLYFTLTAPNFAFRISPLCFSLGHNSLVLTFIIVFLVNISYPNCMSWTLNYS